MGTGEVGPGVYAHVSFSFPECPSIHCTVKIHTFPKKTRESSPEKALRGKRVGEAQHREKGEVPTHSLSKQF